MAGSALMWLMSSLVHWAPTMSSVTSIGIAGRSTSATRSSMEALVSGAAPTMSGCGVVTVTTPGCRYETAMRASPPSSGAEGSTSRAIRSPPRPFCTTSTGTLRIASLFASRAARASWALVARMTNSGSPLEGLAGSHPGRVLAPAAVETEAVGPDRVEVRAACRHLDSVASAVEQRRERAADRTRSDDADSHDCEPNVAGAGARLTSAGDAHGLDARRAPHPRQARRPRACLGRPAAAGRRARSPRAPRLRRTRPGPRPRGTRSG